MTAVDHANRTRCWHFVLCQTGTSQLRQNRPIPHAATIKNQAHYQQWRVILPECDAVKHRKISPTFRRNILPPSSVPNLEAACISEMWMNFYQTRQHHISEYRTLQHHCCENLKFNTHTHFISRFCEIIYILCVEPFLGNGSVNTFRDNGCAYNNIGTVGNGAFYSANANGL
jgi:hypothetical protein